MANLIEVLFQYADMGWSIIPIKANSKQPAVDWKSFQTTPATKEQISQWYQLLPDCNWAVITGKVSSLFIVDCDTPEAEQAAEELGLTNGCSVSTPHGRHFYFRYNNDGKNRKTISGYGSNGTYWPQIKGLDARSDGGYALLPPSSGYEWDIEEEIIEEEITDYKDWKGATFPEAQQQTLPASQPATKMYGGKFSDLDLTNTVIAHGSKSYNATRAKFAEIAAQYPEGKIQRGGSGIHDATYAFLAEEALIVGIGPALEEAGRKFMEEFFESPLTDGRFETSLATVRRKERENHPERFDANGIYTYNLANQGVPNIPQIQSADPAPEPNTNNEYDFGLITTDDARQFKTATIECWQAPWLPKNSIIQVYGYSGHGKSLFLQHALFHAACGLHFGPFERAADKPKILYMDFENGRGTIGRRYDQLAKSFGNPDDRLLIWTPWLRDDYINLREPEGVTKLLHMLKQVQPDILVIDTLRSAYPALNENSAEEWASINQLSLKIRNAGCTVILVHHSNKPTKEGLGREAGSSNQLTTLETQLRITQVFKDADMAKTKGGIFSGDIMYDPFHAFQKQAPINSTVSGVFEVSYGKVREWTDLHDMKQYVGLATRPNGETYLCYSDGPKVRLRKLVQSGYNLSQIINTMGRPMTTLEEWAQEQNIKLPSN